MWHYSLHEQRVSLGSGGNSAESLLEIEVDDGLVIQRAILIHLQVNFKVNFTRDFKKFNSKLAEILALLILLFTSIMSMCKSGAAQCRLSVYHGDAACSQITFGNLVIIILLLCLMMNMHIHKCHCRQPSVECLSCRPTKTSNDPSLTWCASSDTCRLPPTIEQIPLDQTCSKPN